MSNRGMIDLRFVHACWVSLWVVLASAIASAGLPGLDEEEWEGCYAVHESQRYDLSIGTAGEIWLIPKQRDKDHVAKDNRIRIYYGIEEVKDDGKTVLKTIDEDSLVSEQEATDRLEKIVIQGEATGGSKFELVIEESRGEISIGGRVLDAGKLTKYPLRFTVRANIPYAYVTPDRKDKRAQRDFARLMKRDRMELERLDGSRASVSLAETPNEECLELNGDGIEKVEVKIGYYENRKFYFVADGESSMHLINGGDAEPMYLGFSLNWVRTAEQDPEAEARMRFWVK